MSKLDDLIERLEPSKEPELILLANCVKSEIETLRKDMQERFELIAPGMFPF